jgi:UDP-glucose 4-epimerase
MSTVLVTGAAGNLGRRVLTELLSSRFADQVLAVDKAPLEATAADVETHCLDLAAAGAGEELAALAKRAAVILHLAWAPEGKHNLDVLRNVLDAAEEIEPLHLVHLSSATVYGAWPDNPVPITEEVAPRPNPELAYAVEKRAAEVLVDRWAASHQVTAVALLRPACTVGAAGHPLYRALAETSRPALGAEGRMVQYLHIDDLVGAVAHTVRLGLAGTYNVAPDGGVHEEVAGALAGGSAMLPLPEPARALLASARQRLATREVARGTRAYATHSWVVSPDKLRLTGWAPEYSSEQALVVSDQRRHWDDLPQSRRVALTLAGATCGAVLTGAAATAMWRRKR